MKYLLLCCIEEQTFEAMPTSECEAFMDALAVYCKTLQKNGHLIAAEPLESVQKAVTVRGREDTVSVTDGPFAETKEQIGGFFLINARDLNEAIRSSIDLGFFYSQTAAKALTARDWNGVVVHELLGPRDLTYTEATRILGERIGKPDLQYVQFSYADTARALMEGGLSESFAKLYVAMTQAFNEGVVKPRDGRTPENTTPARFEDFVSELAHAYQEM